MSVIELPVRHRNEPCCGTTASPKLTKRQTQSLAKALRAVGDETRLRMLDLIAQQPEPCCVCDITPQFDQNQPTVSHHLKLLRDAGLIDTEKRGIWAFYWATEQGTDLLAAVAALA